MRPLKIMNIVFFMKKKSFSISFLSFFTIKKNFFVETRPLHIAYMKTNLNYKNQRVGTEYLVVVENRKSWFAKSRDTLKILLVKTGHKNFPKLLLQENSFIH